ncbi:YfbU family protein [Thermaerobacillus caldiproteolyticus]|uniref:YfbU family protein n=1 Tax=Thermaerobacillus caldiproteolyticus TaxID=247480 RepID=UPI00358DA7FF
MRKLNDKGDVKESDLKSAGFDGNTETLSLAYAKYFMHELDKYKELRNTSHYLDYDVAAKIG